MREVRMTFGEHLEELRKRIIFSLLYLAGGLGVTFAYGEELLEWTLGPHYQAVTAAQRDRLVNRMSKTARRLEELTSAVPPTLAPGKKPLVDGPVTAEDWALLFTREVTGEQIVESLEMSFREFAARLARDDLPSIPQAERAQLARSIEVLGREHSRRVAEELTPGIGSPEFWNLPERFRRIHRILSDAEATVGPSGFQEAIGWGKDLALVTGPIEAFLEFLEARKEQVREARIPVAVLRAHSQESKLPEALHELCVSIEKDARTVAEGEKKSIMVTSYLESFMAYLKVAFIFGIFLALPFILYELWKFIGAGLYPQEQKYVVTLLPFSLGLFGVGILFGYFAMIPVGLQFLASWGIEDVDLNFTLDNYIGLFFTLTLILGLVFQTPLVMIFLAKIGIASVPIFKKYRRVAIFLGVCLAVVFTPPDPFSWILMAIPMVFLYEVGILTCTFLARRERKMLPGGTTA
ncbi:MAG TPA: twin-arginine translocase subunit TatC [Planctomycetota bacterium]|nr:twin-arginine translocase subunit TatC [Planctomycetota bacterium]